MPCFMAYETMNPLEDHDFDLDEYFVHSVRNLSLLYNRNYIVGRNDPDYRGKINTMIAAARLERWNWGVEKKMFGSRGGLSNET